MDNIKDSIDLVTLVGEHILFGCDCSTEQVKDWGEIYVSAGVMRFNMDGKVYEAIENPDDGYRSTLEGLHIPDTGVVVQNMFAPTAVIAVHQSQSHSSMDDILELRNAKTGKVIIKIGTSDINDYYPGCVMEFNPENL